MTVYGDRKLVTKAAGLVKREAAVRGGFRGRGALGGFQLDNRSADRISRGIVQLSFPAAILAGLLLGAERKTHETQEYLQGRYGGGQLRKGRPV